MTTTKSAKGRKPLLFFFIYLLFLTLLTPFIAHAYTSYQDNAQNTGRNTDTSNYFAYDGSLSGVATIDADYQALIYNLDGTGINEVIISDDANIYSLDENAVIIRQTTLTENVMTQPVIWTFEGTDYLAVMTNTSVYLYNGLLEKKFNYTLTSGTALRSSLECVTNKNCYVIYDNSTNTTVLTFNTTTKTETLGTLVNISDDKEMSIESNTDNKAYITCDADENGAYGLCAYDLANQILDTAFSSDGILDNIANKEQISAPLTYPFDGGTHEIGISYISCTAGTDTNYNLGAYRSDGTVYNTRTIVLLNDRGGCSDASQWSYPVITEIAGTDAFYMCGIAEGQPASYINEDRGFFCFKVSDSSLFNRTFNPDGTQLEYNLIASDFNGDTVASTDYDDYAWYTGLYDETMSQIYDLEDTFDSSGAKISIGDIDGDGNTEIVGVTPTNVKILSHADQVETLQQQIISDSQNNSVRTTLLNVADATGLNLGLTAMWLIVMLFLAFMIWNMGNTSDPKMTVGAMMIIEAFATVLGMYLGFLSVGLGVILLVFGIAIIVFGIQKNQTGGM